MYSNRHDPRENRAELVILLGGFEYKKELLFSNEAFFGNVDHAEYPLCVFFGENVSDV